MKLWIIRWVMAFAWTVDEYADEFVEWEQRGYIDSLYKERNRS